MRKILLTNQNQAYKIYLSNQMSASPLIVLLVIATWLSLLALIIDAYKENDKKRKKYILRDNYNILK
jgi:hypothetical protein